MNFRYHVETFIDLLFPLKAETESTELTPFRFLQGDDLPLVPDPRRRGRRDDGCGRLRVRRRGDWQQFARQLPRAHRRRRHRTVGGDRLPQESPVGETRESHLDRLHLALRGHDALRRRLQHCGR